MTIQTALGASTSPAPVRASNAEREETIARLHDALGEGRLDLAEIEPRVAAAYAAQYRHELVPLLADLPQGSTAARPVGTGMPTWAELWVGAVWRGRAALLGADERPSSAQLRAAAVFVALALAWTALWAVVAAAVLV